MSGGVTPKQPIPAELDMMNALDNLLSALNDATLVDGEGSAPLSQLQNEAMTKGESLLNGIYKKDISGKSGSSLSKGQVEYNQANATVNNVEQQAGNLVSKATNDVNSDSSQQQQLMNMASTIINGVGFFNNLLSQAFAS